MQNALENLPVLETQRLILRKIDKNDAHNMFHYGSNTRVSEKVTWETHKTLEDTEAFIEFVLKGYDEKKMALWGIELKDSGQLIGTIDFVAINNKHKNGEIGYVLSPEHWGQGITTEASQRVLEFGFRELGLVRIQARCFTENIGSQRVMEKAGMSFEGIIRKGMLVKGDYQDLKLYSILADEFEQPSSIE